MHDHYDHRTIECRPHAAAGVLDHLRGPGRAAVEGAGGTLVGIFTPLIGLASTQLMILTGWSDEPGDRGRLAHDGHDDVVGAAHEHVVATVRPAEPRTLDAPGVHAHRWFELADADWPEFLHLSQEAWPGFESGFGAEIVGLFRSAEVEPPSARALLLTRYPDLATWEQSRMRGEVSSEEAEVRARFVRRHTLTRRTVVTATNLAPL